MDKVKGKWIKNFTTYKVILNKESLQANIYKSNLVNLSRSTIFERCKKYKEDCILKESLVQEEKLSILMSIFNIYWI